MLRNRPVLAIGLVGGLMSSNEFDGVEERLQDIERQLALPGDELVVVDRDEFARIPASIEMYRAALALNAGDPGGTIAHAERTLAMAAEDDDLPRAAASALSGLASWSMGDLEAAHRGYTVATEGLRRAGHIADVCGTSDHARRPRADPRAGWARPSAPSSAPSSSPSARNPACAARRTCWSG